MRELYLGGTKVTDAGLRQLAGLQRLRVLSLENLNVTDAGLKELAPLAGLRELDLYGTKATDAGLKHLEALHKLERLGLARTQVTDKGLKQLKGLKKLKGLDVQETRITAAGQKEIREALPEVKFGPCYQMPGWYETFRELERKQTRERLKHLESYSIPDIYPTPGPPAESQKSIWPEQSQKSSWPDVPGWLCFAVLAGGAALAGLGRIGKNKRGAA